MNQPILVPIMGKESGNRWRLTGAWDGKENLTGPWRYDFRINKKSYRLTIPFLFNVLDGATVPRLAQAVLRMGGREMPDEAWIPHDFFYHFKGKMPIASLFVYELGTWKEVKEIDRKFADEVFYNELKSDRHGLSDFKPIISYLAIRAAFWKNF